VLPFTNDLFTNQEFIPFFLRKFGLLGPINRELQKFLSDFYQWKKTNLPPDPAPGLNDFYEMPLLRQSEQLFYQVGLTPAEAIEVLDRHFHNLNEFARWIVAQVHGAVLNDPEIGSSVEYIGAIKLRNLRFDPEAIRAGRKEMATA